MKIICIGRNYAEHAIEMNSPKPKQPVFFLKPDSAILPKRNPFFIPDFTQNLHYECELVFRINKLGKNISKKFAHTYYDEIGLGIDFTARDLQDQCKEKSLPWEIAKAFDNSAVISENFIDKSAFDLNNVSFSLLKNGQIVQHGNSKDMLFNIDEIIVYISQFMTLKIGDLIYTGTPAGVGPVKINDVLTGYIGETKMYEVKIK
jgi:acylpyruvate hydrolase